MEHDDREAPGRLVESLLAEREWDQSILALILGVHRASVSRLVSGKTRVDAKLALELGEAFGVDPERFLALQQSEDLREARVRNRPDEDRVMRALLFANFPVAEMANRGWVDVKNSRDMRAVESELLKFFGARSLSEIPMLPHAAKKSDAAGPVTPVQTAWINRVKQIARGMIVAPYSRAAALKAVEEMSDLLNSSEEARMVPRILADAGIRFVIVEGLKGSKIDGVCCWLDPNSPVIGVSLRFDRIDNFWFVVRHELEHVLRGHGKDTVLLDAELEGERAGTGQSVSEEERVANAAAANFCVPTDSIDDFIARKTPIFIERDLLGFSRIHGIHPGIVAGQLQRKTQRYDLFRKYLVKIRSIVSPSAMVDGWGDVAPIVA